MERCQRKKLRELAPEQLQITKQNKKLSIINKVNEEILRKGKHNETVRYHGNKE